MFVNTPRVYKRLDFSLRLEKNFDARLIGRVPINMVHIGRIYLGVEMIYLQVSFGPQHITGECKLWCQNIYDIYVASHL